ncbi:MAG: ATP-binding protein [Thermoanaerobaculia bacterium]
MAASGDPDFFRPRARLLQLLGDELIGNPRLAVFELVKNAYDACAREVVVTLAGLGTDHPRVTVRDDGDGMSLETIRDVWLVPGHDHRKRERRAGVRSHCGRLPLGEKGVGRFAVLKLGYQVTLVTRAAGQKECVVKIQWQELIDSAEYLSGAPVEIQTREPEVFSGDSTGTQIEVRELQQTTWTRGEIRRLYRQITSICSPFKTPEDFSVELKVPGREHDLEDIPGVHDLVDRAFWHFTFFLDGESYSWHYEFRPAGLKLQGRIVDVPQDQLLVPDLGLEEETGSRRGKNKKDKLVDTNTLKGIGPIMGEFHVYDRDKEVLRQLPEIRLLEEFLDQQGGIRVYRDGIRVHNYGEPGDDWLGLDLRRVNRPTRKLSRNLILGEVHLDLRESVDLIERTSREGFVENDALSRLRKIVLQVLATLERERLKDKENIRRLLAKEESEDQKGIRGPLEALKRELKKAHVYERCESHVLALEHRYEEMKENLLRPAISNLNLALVFHEVERGVRELVVAVKNGESPAQLEQQAGNMAQLLDDFSKLLRQNEKQRHPIAKVVDQMRRINLHRFRFHAVRLECALSMDLNPGFEAFFSFGLVLGALNNLIDNAIYWMRIRWPEEPESWEGSPRKLCIMESHDFEGGPCLVVADTGPGFRDDPADLVRPFFTRRPEGMGLGLYYANMVMELVGGRLLFPQRGEVDLPEGFDGAVIAFQFPEAE